MYEKVGEMSRGAMEGVQALLQLKFNREQWWT